MPLQCQWLLCVISPTRILTHIPKIKMMPLKICTGYLCDCISVCCDIIWLPHQQTFSFPFWGSAIFIRTINSHVWIKYTPKPCGIVNMMNSRKPKYTDVKWSAYGWMMMTTRIWMCTKQTQRTYSKVIHHRNNILNFHWSTLDKNHQMILFRSRLSLFVCCVIVFFFLLLLLPSLAELYSLVIPLEMPNIHAGISIPLLS